MESTNDETASIPSNVTNISPHCLNGSLSPENNHSIDWSLNGLIAFGCHNKVIVVDSKHTLRVCQTLNKHKYAVKTVKWDDDSSMRLLSCDVNGNIIVWDVNEASVLTIIVAEPKELKHLLTASWIKTSGDASKRESQHNILALYNGNNIVLYDSENGDIIWKKCFGNPGNDDYFAKRFCVDPFNSSNIVVSLQPSCPSNVDCCFAVINDVMQSKLQVHRYMVYISSEATPGSPIRSASASRILHVIKEMGSSLSKANDPPFQPNYLLEYIKIGFNRCTRDQIVLLFQREVMVVDIEFVQILVMIPIERNCSNFVDFYTCFYRNMIYCLHENGTISARLLQKKRRREEHIGSDLIDLSYSTICLSDGMRLTKHHKVYGFAVSPISEIHIALLMNNSKIFIYKLHRKNWNRPPDFIAAVDDIILREDYEAVDKDLDSKKFSLVMSRTMGAVSSGPHIIRMCPPLTMRNWKVHKPYLAVGDSAGLIQVYNVSTNTLEKELSIHNSPIRGIEWVSLAAFLSFSHTNVQGQSGRVTNELCLTDVISGRSEALRVEPNKDSSPIESLKVSHLKQYFILALKNEPFEIWDLKKLTLLQVMAKHTPVITAVEWSPLYNKKVSESNEATETKAAVKENFVVTNANSELHHFSVEGNVVKQISSTPDLNGPNITSIAWKSDHLVLGDADGNLSIWYLKGRVTKAESTHRGWIKKMRFAPGRGNMKCLILFNDGVDVWDIKDVKLASQLKHPRDIGSKIQDIDWAGSDRPILSLSDDSIIVCDLKLKKYTSPLISPISNLSTISASNTIIEKNLMCLPEAQRFLIQSNIFHNKMDDMSLFPSDDLQRYLFVAKLFGEKQWIHFWYLASHYLQSSESSESTFNCDTNYETYADLSTFRSIQKDKIAVYEGVRSTHKHNQKCCELNLWLGNNQRAIQLLLETEPSLKDPYFRDSLKACLIALLTSTESQSSHPVLKLVATNLIANESIDEGIQLLSLIDKAKDACRYLQSHGLWKEAALVAKLRLADNSEEYTEIMNSHCKYLEACNCVDSKLLCLLSLKSYTKVIELLLEMKEIQKGALFCNMLQEKIGLPKSVRETVVEIYRRYIILLKDASLDNISQEFDVKLTQLLSDQ